VQDNLVLIPQRVRHRELLNGTEGLRESPTEGCWLSEENAEIVLHRLRMEQQTLLELDVIGTP
jgi:hypothetical protein